eukprot:gene2366-2833_t
MSSQQMFVNKFVKDWKDAVKDHDHSKISNLFAEKTTFYSPIVHTSYHQKEVILQILKWVIEIIEEFEYIQTYQNDQEMTVCLLFQGKIFEKKKQKRINIQGVDLFKLNKEGKITELKVMLRPLNGTLELASEMKKRFAILKSKM